MFSTAMIILAVVVILFIGIYVGFWHARKSVETHQAELEKKRIRRRQELEDEWELRR